jgi:hypothetical protein
VAYRNAFNILRETAKVGKSGKMRWKWQSLLRETPVPSIGELAAEKL